MDIVIFLGDKLWYVLIVLLVACAVYFTVRTRGVQFGMFGEMIRLMLGRDTKKREGIGSFQAFAVSLSSRVGTGNLAGVASAIFVGGPGAVFWMWMMALLGAATAFMEATLAQLYKRKGEDSYYGGPAYYMLHGLHSKVMGVVFAVLMVLTFGIANQAVQSNTLSAALVDSFGWSNIVIGIVLAIATFIIIAGGIKSISKVLSIIVPIMAIGYVLLALYVLVVRASAIPDALRLIVDSAFGIRQAAGGAVGVAIMQGVRRGLFSNEAGEGSAPNAAAIAETSHPVKQGLIQSLGVYIDTIVICTCTALIILLSGVWDCGKDGIVLTQYAMETEVGAAGKYFVTAAIFLFSFSTLIANYYYGETNIRFVSGKKWPVYLFRVFTAAILFIGCLIPLQAAWNIIDLAMALLTICNLSALIPLSGRVFKLLRNYREQKKAGKEPVFRKTDLPECMDDIECW